MTYSNVNRHITADILADLDGPILFLFLIFDERAVVVLVEVSNGDD